jgi:hypothetical protein
MVGMEIHLKPCQQLFRAGDDRIVSKQCAVLLIWLVRLDLALESEAQAQTDFVPNATAPP